ncbi:hypothetical protein V8C42DRAFT_356001 [Trichoderma barbatum]
MGLFPQTLRNQMCIKIAYIPVLIGLIYFSLPSVLLAFTLVSNWTANDTQNSLIACSLMTGASLFEFMIYREDFFWHSLLLHGLMIFIFFSAATGGRYLDHHTLYKYFAICVTGLTVTTVLSCHLNVLYFLQTWDEAYRYFGLAAPLPIVWETFECYLQWRWLLRFYKIEAKLCLGDRRPKDFLDESDSAMEGTAIKHEIPSAFPRGTVFVLRALDWQCVVLLLWIYFKFERELYMRWSFHQHKRSPKWKT